MTEIKKKEKAKCVYVPPLTEVYAAKPCAFLAGTAFFGINAGSASFGNFFSNGGSASNGGGGSAGAANLSTGAKAVILGQEFSFSDPWEE